MLFQSFVTHFSISIELTLVIFVILVILAVFVILVVFHQSLLPFQRFQRIRFDTLFVNSQGFVLNNWQSNKLEQIGCTGQSHAFIGYSRLLLWIK